MKLKNESEQIFDFCNTCESAVSKKKKCCKKYKKKGKFCGSCPSK